MTGQRPSIRSFSAAQRGMLALLLALVLLTNAGIWLLSYRNIEGDRARIDAEIAERTTRLATLTEASLSAEAQRIELALAAIVDQLEHQWQHGPVGDAGIDAILAQFDARVGSGVAFRMTDAVGLLRWGSRIDRSSPVSMADREHFLAHRQTVDDRTHFAGPHHGRLVGETVVHFSRALRTPRGDFAGIVFAVIPVRVLQEQLTALPLGTKGSATIRALDKRLIARAPASDDPVWQPGSTRVAPEFQKILDSGAPAGYYHSVQTPDGTEREIAFRRIRNMPATLIVGLAPEDFLADWRRDVRYTMFLLALLFAVSTGAAGLVWRAWQRQTSAMAETMKAKEALSDQQQHLEELVAQRTQELEASRKNLAEALAEAQRLARVKSVFLAHMSHEIRTPLNAILGFVHLLHGESSSPRVAARLEKIDTAGRHLLELINQVLDYARIEAGKLTLDTHPCAPSALLDMVRSMIEPGAQAKGLVVDIDNRLDPGLWIEADETRLRQALLNLAGNAVKFTERGKIVLRVSQVEAEAGKIGLRFEVEDTGPGIDPGVLPRLFEPFEQSGTGEGGTGLGLAIVRGLAEQMGGTAGASSRPGAGSTFWFTGVFAPGAPAARDSTVCSDCEQALQRRHAGARILLAEDDPVNREVAIELLSAVGIAVDSAENGRVAVEKAQSGHYRLVLMDMQMPEMTGLEATRAIRALPHFASLPIVAMTANAFAEDRRACLAAGMNDFVPKPIEPEQLYATLFKWLNVTAG